MRCPGLQKVDGDRHYFVVRSEIIQEGPHFRF